MVKNGSWVTPSGAGFDADAEIEGSRGKAFLLSPARTAYDRIGLRPVHVTVPIRICTTWRPEPGSGYVSAIEDSSNSGNASESRVLAGRPDANFTGRSNLASPQSQKTGPSWIPSRGGHEADATYDTSTTMRRTTWEER